jgi:hypothetical protein
VLFWSLSSYNFNRLTEYAHILQENNLEINLRFCVKRNVTVNEYETSSLYFASGLTGHGFNASPNASQSGQANTNL